MAYKARTARMLRTRWKKLGVPSLAGLCADKVWKMMAWVAREGEVPVLKALRFGIGWRTTAWWEEQECVEHEVGPAEFLLLEAQIGIP